MSLVILNGSIQKNNGSGKTATIIREAYGKDVEIISLVPFTEQFRGDYIYFSNATTEQLRIMESMRDADMILFVVPTYFKAMPGALKNFFDIVREKSLYEHKVFAFIASNHKNQDFGARQALLVVQGILEFFETQAVWVPEIGIINPESPDRAVATQVVAHLWTLHKSYRPDYT